MEIFPCSYGEDIRVLDVPCLHFYPSLTSSSMGDRYAKIARIFEASRALGFCPSFTRASNPQLHFGNPISKSYRLTDSDFLLKQFDAFLALEDDTTSPEVDHSYYDSEGDILLLEAFLNDDTSLPPPTQGMYLPQIRKELQFCEA
ncbi:hypothetical protein Tco_1066434 [Tanacetum coccineum]|uniref:Reverse transcriptase domain-containing protein n=1 Tax=Tanacetum coccineum TaxID=301880 RepID=A0ABQ5HBR4_9ASTR